MSQQECLDYSQQEKTIFTYLQVAMQERLGATEIEAEGERQEDCWL